MSINYSKKVDRLLESKKPSINILLEREITPKKASSSSSSSKDSSGEKNKDKKPTFDFSDLDSKKDKKSKDKEEKKDDDFSFDLEDDDEDSSKEEDDLKLEPEQKPEEKEDEEDPEEQKEEEKQAALERATIVNAAFVTPFEKTSNPLEDAIAKVFESAFTRKMSLKNSFVINEKRIFGIHNKLLKEDSFSDATSNIDISINKMISNAINLTKNFIEVVDIPELIVNSIASKFAEKAAADDDENSANEYRIKLEEFIEGYMRELIRIDDYKNYDVSAYVMKNQPKYHTSVGARPTT